MMRRLVWFSRRCFWPASADDRLRGGTGHLGQAWRRGGGVGATRARGRGITTWSRELDAVGADELLGELPDDAQDLMERTGDARHRLQGAARPLARGVLPGDLGAREGAHPPAADRLRRGARHGAALRHARRAQDLPLGGDAVDRLRGGGGGVRGGVDRLADHRLHHDDRRGHPRLLQLRPRVHPDLFVDCHSRGAGGHRHHLHRLPLHGLPGGLAGGGRESSCR